MLANKLFDSHYRNYLLYYLLTLLNQPYVVQTYLSSSLARGWLQDAFSIYLLLARMRCFQKTLKQLVEVQFCGPSFLRFTSFSYVTEAEFCSLQTSSSSKVVAPVERGVNQRQYTMCTTACRSAMQKSRQKEKRNNVPKATVHSLQTYLFSKYSF